MRCRCCLRQPSAEFFLDLGACGRSCLWSLAQLGKHRLVPGPDTRCNAISLQVCQVNFFLLLYKCVLCVLCNKGKDDSRKKKLMTLEKFLALKCYEVGFFLLSFKIKQPTLTNDRSSSFLEWKKVAK